LSSKQNAGDCSKEEAILTKHSYAKAGVDIDANDRATELIGKVARAASRPEVLSGVGPFGGLFELKGFKNPVLVSSTDSVGTKLIIAINMEKYDTVGTDIVNHCINDIFTCGAEPLFFLDYIGIGKMIPEKVAEIVESVARACSESGCALIGGETAEMPDVYSGNDYDLVGFVIGGIEKDRIITGENITAGDVVIGLPSSGPHTNGYSLIRDILGDSKADMEKVYPGIDRPIGEALLEPHTSYFRQLQPFLHLVKGMAHITGGGLIGNLPRILPAGLSASLKSGNWSIPPLFRLIEEKGNVDHAEMFRVFNMGIGMAVVCSPADASELTGALPGSRVIGEVVPQTGDMRITIL